LTSQNVSDMGGGPVFYSTLAQLEKVADPVTEGTLPGEPVNPS
jgi:hypothetical protein